MRGKLLSIQNLIFHYTPLLFQNNRSVEAVIWLKIQKYPLTDLPHECSISIRGEVVAFVYDVFHSLARITTQAVSIYQQLG